MPWKPASARYACLMREFAEMPQLEVARFQVHRMDVAKPVHEALLKAERATPLHTLEQLTEAGKKNAAAALQGSQAHAHAGHRRARRRGPALA